MHSTWVVILIVLFGLLILGGFILFFKSSSSSNPIPVCNCLPTELCDPSTGTCTLKTCPPRQIPSGSTCTLDQLKCDSTTNFNWICPLCPSGFVGDNCQCKSSDRKLIISDLCNRTHIQVPTCQPDGTWVSQPATSCKDVFDYINAVGTTFTEECGNTCGPNQADICTGDPPHLECDAVCPPLPPDGSDPCGACNTDEACICDIRTQNKWACSKVTEQLCPGSDFCCPPTDPLHQYCKTSTGQSQGLSCTTCSGGKGYLQYCPGTKMWPTSCMVLNHLTSKEGTPYEVDVKSDLLPVFPTIDNDKCKVGGIVSTSFLTDYDGSYLQVKNPSGWLYSSGGDTHFQSKTPDSARYPTNYPSQETELVSCLWDNHSTCSNGQGQWTQLCSKNKNPDNTCGTDTYDCSPDEEITRCMPSDKGFRCKCNSQPGTNPPKPYQGSECQYTDRLNCSNNGSVQGDGTCICNPGFLSKVCDVPFYTVGLLGTWHTDALLDGLSITSITLTDVSQQPGSIYQYNLRIYVFATTYVEYPFRIFPDGTMQLYYGTSSTPSSWVSQGILPLDQNVTVLNLTSLIGVPAALTR